MLSVQSGKMLSWISTQLRRVMAILAYTHAIISNDAGGFLLISIIRVIATLQVRSFVCVRNTLFLDLTEDERPDRTRGFKGPKAI